MLRRFTLLVALVPACERSIPAGHPRPIAYVRTTADFILGDRVYDPSSPKLIGTITQMPDTGHHWLQTPFRVEWDNGQHTEWNEGEIVPLCVVGVPC